MNYCWENAALVSALDRFEPANTRVQLFLWRRAALSVSVAQYAETEIMVLLASALRRGVVRTDGITLSHPERDPLPCALNEPLMLRAVANGSAASECFWGLRPSAASAALE